MGQELLIQNIKLLKKIDQLKPAKLLRRIMQDNFRPQSICGPYNAALYGPCIASSAKSLEVSGVPNADNAAQAGLPFTLSVQKQDFYRQVISSDSSSYFEIEAVVGVYEDQIDHGASISGSSLLKLMAGSGSVSVAIKPRFKIVSEKGILALSSNIHVRVKGEDAQTLIPLSSNPITIPIASNANICPKGFVVVLDPPIRAGAARSGVCTYCQAGTYSVDPLYGVSGNSTYPACLNCPTSVICKGGNDVVFGSGEWIVSAGMYLLVSCPKGHALFNLIGGLFSHDNQHCVQCSADEYILDTNSSKYSCQKCPVGGVCDGASFQGAVQESVWKPNVRLGQYILIHCPPGYELLNTIRNGVFSHVNQECSICPPSYFCVGGNTSRRPCPFGSFVESGANSSISCIPVVFVNLIISLPIGASEFGATSQQKFLLALANICVVSVRQIVIDEMVQIRRTSSAGLRIASRVAAQDSEAAVSLKARLSEDTLSKQFSNVGLPPATLLSVTIQGSTTPNSDVALGMIVGTTVGSCVLLFGLLAVLMVRVFKRGETAEGRELRIMMAELRVRLKISKKDGYILSTEGASMWQQDCFVLQTSYLEAASRLALLRDFEVNQFDAFCLCIECGTPKNEEPGGGTAYRAVLDWLLEVSAELIRPEMQVLDPKDLVIGEAKVAKPKNTCRLRIEERFPYFIRKVCKLRIWEDDGGFLFERLRSVARNFMNDIALLCDSRFESLCAQQGGAELIAFFASPESSIPLAAGHILRQDHDEV
jgi:hypothetical protein